MSNPPLDRVLVLVGLLALLAGGETARTLTQEGDTTCTPPSPTTAPLVQPDTPLADHYSGTYGLTVVTTVSYPDRDTIVRGRLELWPTHDEYRAFVPNPDIVFPLQGISDIDLASLGPVSLAYELSSRDPERPGVQAVYVEARHELTLEFGAASSPASLWVDAGVLFQVFEIDSAGFSGRWRDGGLRSPLPQGYFCARRLSGDWTGGS